MSTGDLSALVTRLEAAVTKLERVGVAGHALSATLSGPADETCTVPYVVAYDELLSGPFKAFLECSSKIGEDVAEMARLVEGTFRAQRAFLVCAAKSQRPLDTELPTILEPTGKKIQEVIAFRESRRTSPYFNHLSAISESIPGLSWVAVTPAPGPYAREMGDAAVFYTNRVLKDYREKDKVHVDWVQNWNAVFRELQDYIKVHHPTGVSWNSRGGNAEKNLREISTVSPPGIPPPPPGIPPPPPMMPLVAKEVPTEADTHSALFQDINKGLDITSTLKRVPEEMKTHKNPSLREGPKPFTKAQPGNGVSPFVNSADEHPPRKVLEGKKWFIEYQRDAPNITIADGKMDHSIYIYRCTDTVVQVKGKVNSIILDSCKKSSVVFDSVVSAVEIVNCQSVQMQVMHQVPTIAIEKTDGCQVYMSSESLNVELITAKSSEMNVLIPRGGGDYTECAIPEQFKTTIQGTKLNTVITEKAG